MPKTTVSFDVHDATMHAIHPRNLRHVDWLMLLFVLALAAIGWASLHSAGRSYEGGNLVEKQILFFCLGTIIATTLICIDYRLLVSLAPVMYTIAIIALLIVLYAGHTAKGSFRWISLGPFNLQPSELCKIVLIYMLAWYFSRIGDKIKKFHYFIFALLLTAVPVILILAQPNLGTAASLIPLAFAMLFVAGCRLRHLALMLLLGISIIPLTWFQLNDFEPSPNTTIREQQRVAHEQNRHPYDLHFHQKMRIYTFINPETDPRGSGWQTIQSKITVGSGGLSGKGYMEGTQTRLDYLPEHHTDFIFSQLAEEHGFLGVVIVIALFSVFLLRGLIFARDCPEIMGTLLATGVVTILAFHIFVNIAITVGLLPVTGLPLPFLSYGGSFYLTTMAGVGILMNVPMRRRVFVN
jgi:rod shape determining protein RodA